MSDGFSYLGDLSPNVSGFSVPSITWGDRGIAFQLAAKADGRKLPATGQYYYNIYNQLFKPVDEEIDYELGERRRKYLNNFLIYNEGQEGILPTAPEQFILDNAPSFAYDILRFEGDPKSQPIPTFEGLVATAILTGKALLPDGSTWGDIKTPEDVDKFVTWLFGEGGASIAPPEGSKLPEDSSFGITDRRAYAKNLWLEKQAAEKKWKELKEGYESEGVQIYDKRGLPNRNLRYDPRSVEGYTNWENKKIAELRSKNKDITSVEVEMFKSKLRKAAADEYAKQGYSPFYDAILLARAGS